MVVVAVVGTVLLIGAAIAGGVVAANRSPSGSAAATTLPPVTDTTTTAPAITPGTTAPGTASGSLGASVPSAFSDDCTPSASADYLDGAASAQVVCTGLSVPDADSIIYVQYPQSQQAEDYFTRAIQANGVTAGMGQCSSLQLAGTATNGTYCENPVSTSAGDQVGNQFVFEGTSFAIGSGNNVSDLCAAGDETTSTTPGFTIVGWTDDPTNLAGLAISCATDQATAQALENDFLGGQYDLRRQGGA